MAVKGIRCNYAVLDEEFTFRTTGFLFAVKPLDLRGYSRRRFRVRKDRLREF